MKKTFFVFMVLLVGLFHPLMAGCDTQPVSAKVILNVEGPGTMIFLSSNQSKENIYVITLTNENKQVFKNARVECAIPECLQFISADPRGSIKSLQSKDVTMFEWNVGDIKYKDQKEVKLVLKPNDIRKSELLVNLTEGFFKQGNNVKLSASQKITIIGIPAMYITTYDTEDPVEVGSNTTFVIEMQNEGTLPCTNVVLANLLDSEMKFVVAEAPVKYSVAGKKIKFDPIPILEPGEKVTYKITCTAIEEGSSKNTASVKYDEFSQELLDQEGTSVYN